MSVLKTFQHDPLGRQCAEALRIKSIEPSKRINNRKEYHQPGDVEVCYEKNESEEMKMKRKINKEKKLNQKRLNHIVSTQGNATYSCDQCDYKATLKESLEEHVGSVHENVSTNIEEFLKQIRTNTKSKVACDQYEYKANSKVILKTHIESVHEKIIYSCEQCEYKATLKESLNAHRENVHNTEDDNVEDVCSTQNMIAHYGYFPHLFLLSLLRSSGYILLLLHHCVYFLYGFLVCSYLSYLLHY